MFDELVKQVQRLFSSKKNGGKQVAKLTDQLHYQKLVLVALSIVLLLGYAKLRDDFICQGVHGVNSKVTTRFCLVNGTTTTVAEHRRMDNTTGGLKITSDLNSVSRQQSLSHVGLGFISSKTRTINHNYMRSQWALLILLAICSYCAQRNWSSLFRNDVLQALLQLEGSSESRLVRAAESAKPYEMLSSLSSNLKAELEERMHKNPESVHLSRNEKVSRTIELVDNYVNIYDHKLDYYPNQLTYLLLTRNTASYKLSCMELRRALIINSLISTLYTLIQFILPLLFISSEYLFFGWRYLEAILVYLHKFFTSSEALDVNSIDYELSSRIFPISTQCQYSQYGMTGSLERFTVQCTVAINELCSKLFVVIWWYVVVSLCVEIYCLLTIILCSLSNKTIGWAFGWRYWPQAREQANLVATFRYKRKLLLNQAEIAKQLFDTPQPSGVKFSKRQKTEEAVPIQREDEYRVRVPNLAFQNGIKAPLRRKPMVESTRHLDDSEMDEEKKRLEAEEGPNMIADHQRKAWYNWCPRDVCMALTSFIRRILCCKAQERRKRIDEEAERDINIYYLLYLLYLRVGKSQSCVEEIIKMTAGALENYLDDLEHSLYNKRRMDTAEMTRIATTQASILAENMLKPVVSANGNQDESQDVVDDNQRKPNENESNLCHVV